MPSFGYGVAASARRQTRSALVSFSQNSASAEPSPARYRRAELGVLGDERAVRRAGSTASASSSPHDHVLRNHSVGSTSSVAASGPALRTEMRMQMSSGAALA